MSAIAEEPSGHWNRIYSTKAEAEVSWFEPSPTLSRELIERAGLSRSAAIIDVGGGMSRLTDALARAGYTDLSLLDVSAAALDAVRHRLGAAAGTVDFIEADITRWQPQRTYDLWHDRAVLHFLTEEKDRAAYHAALSAATRSGSHLVIWTFAPAGPERCSGLAARRYGRAELADFLGSGFRIVESFEHDHMTPSGAPQRFHVARAVRL